METGCLKGGDGLLPGEKRRTVIFGPPCLVLSCLPISEVFKLKLLAGFREMGVAFSFFSRLLQIQNRRQATLLLLLVGCEQALLLARWRAWRVFRTCGVGVGGASVARCVCV